MKIKPIETRYKGYRFRSRLEARWAVFFDALNFQWEYEPEGFVLSDGTHYLPDFRVKTPQGKDVWYEIKPSGVLSDTKFDLFLADQWMWDTDDSDPTFRAALLSGDPIEHLGRIWFSQTNLRHQNYLCPRCGFISDPSYGAYFLDEPHQGNDEFGCDPCDFETPTGGFCDSEDGILFGSVTPHKGTLLLEGGEYKKRYARLIYQAAEKARSARFEHGEVPA